MSSMKQSRIDRIRARMIELQIDVLVLSTSADLPWLTGYKAMPLERITALVIPQVGDIKLAIPTLETPRVDKSKSQIEFEIVSWRDGESDIELLAKLIGTQAKTVGFDDRTWSSFLIQLQCQLPKVKFTQASKVTGPLRMRKDEAEFELLREASRANDRVANAIFNGEIPLIGRTEAQVSKAVAQRILDEGHESVNFSIVAVGSNAASPHHDPGNQVIQADQVLLLDFGGTKDHYCSDMTRMVYTGSDIPSEIAEAYDVLKQAQQLGVQAGQIGISCVDVDRTTYKPIREAGYGDYILHRTGHGIGMEEHEDPYMSDGWDIPIEVGFAFSVEPGIYIPGKWGMRLEDLVLATADGPEQINNASHDMICVEA